MKLTAGLMIVAVLAPGLAAAATPSPRPNTALYRKVPTSLINPGHGKPGQPIMTGAGCIGPRANAAQTTTNPITGRAQAAPIVQIPVGGGNGNIASATNRAQQTQACAHPR